MENVPDACKHAALPLVERHIEIMIAFVIMLRAEISRSRGQNDVVIA
jgi:hypothetical protein